MTSFLSEEDQERALDKGLKKVKAQSFHIRTSIEKNNLRQCLKETHTMLAELRNEDLSPRNYYHLFTAVFDEMLVVEDFFKEEINRGRKAHDVYDSVQQAKYLIPRLFLMIIAGGLTMEGDPTTMEEITTDLLGMIKGVQNPTRGLFTRYFLLKRLKDKLPDKDNEELGIKFEDTLKFILANLEEMNRLWIRISSDVEGSEKLLRDKERVELKILVGESINRLASLDSLTMEIYEKEVLPNLVQIILESNDILSQQYIMECIIHAFSDTYNIKCIELILNTFSRLLPEVDIKELFISLSEKLAKFISIHSGQDSTEEDKQLVSSAIGVYPILVQYFDKLQKETFMQALDMDVNKLLILNAAFMKFATKCTDNDIMSSINHILTSTLQCLKQYNKELSSDGIKNLNKLLEVPLQSNFSLFEMVDFSELIPFMDYTNRRHLSLNIIQSLSSPDSKEKLDSPEKIEKLLKLIKPLITESEDAEEEDKYTFEYGQSEVCKMIHVAKSDDPHVVLQIYDCFKNIFVEGDAKRQKITLPALASCIISFCHKVTLGFDNKNNLISEEAKKNPYTIENMEAFDISKIESNEDFNKLMTDVFKVLNELNALVAENDPETALKLNLICASQVNSIQSDRNNFEQACVTFINAALQIYQDQKYDEELKYHFLSQICGYLIHLKILSKENLEKFIKILMDSTNKMVKRGDQFNAMINIGQIYYIVFKDEKKVVDCIHKARKFADFAMTNPQNLVLFVDLLNRFFYFINAEEELVQIQAEQVNEIIELIKNHIQTIKHEVSIDSKFLPPIENYFNFTLEYIQKKKSLENHKAIYDEILKTE